ncbi:hypothetical protein BDZ89DRAFT_1040251 [Hymenopellis radicata]|nr:hypothetical protein BDZ89DRAFT_1040251 [Hymenopellis radicata]
MRTYIGARHSPASVTRHLGMRVSPVLRNVEVLNLLFPITRYLSKSAEKVPSPPKPWPALWQDKVIPPEFYYVFTTEKAEEAFRRPESIKKWPPRDELDQEPWNPKWDNSDQLVYFEKLAPLKLCCQYGFGEEDMERVSCSSLFLLKQQKEGKCPGLLTIATRLILKDDAAGPDTLVGFVLGYDHYTSSPRIRVLIMVKALLDTVSEENPSDSDDLEYTEEHPLPSSPSQHSGSQAQRKPRGKAGKSADTKCTEALLVASVEVEALRKQVDDLK